MIYITGDTHADWMSRLNTDAFPEQKQMTKDDYVIICGDFGIWDNSKREKYNLDWLEDKPFTTLFIDGNHENYDILDSIEVKQWHGGMVGFVRPHVIHLLRGQVYTICDKTFFTFGGASSHDIKDGILDRDQFSSDKEFRDTIKTWYRSGKMFRVNHMSWWSREMPCDAEMEIGRMNLQAAGNKVDYIISHCASTSTAACISQGFYKPDVLTDYLEEICRSTDYKKHFCGHYHIDRNVWGKEIILYEQIIRIV